MSVLTSAPFGLEQGDEVIARVIAINQIGDSDASELSNTHQLAGALVQTAPSKPLNPPSRGSQTTLS